MSPEEMQSFVQRLDIMRRWAESHVGEDDSAHPPVAGIPNLRFRRSTLEEIDQALQRIANGTYAVCDRCLSAIERERLLVRPAAARCAACERAVPKQAD